MPVPAATFFPLSLFPSFSPRAAIFFSSPLRGEGDAHASSESENEESPERAFVVSGVWRAVFSLSLKCPHRPQLSFLLSLSPARCHFFLLFLEGRGGRARVG